MTRSLIPNSTQIPDVILDEWMPKLIGSELAIVLLVARKTFGWGKRHDRISTSQMMLGTGLSESQVIRTCRTLVQKGYLLSRVVNDGKTPTDYALNMNADPCQNERGSKAQKEVLDPCQNDTPVILTPLSKVRRTPVKMTETRNTIQETENHKNDSIGADAPKNKKTPFKKPTLEECEIRFKEIQPKNPIITDPIAEALAFHTHHELRNWVPSGQRAQMTNWHLAITQWLIKKKRYEADQLARGRRGVPESTVAAPVLRPFVYVPPAMPGQKPTRQ